MTENTGMFQYSGEQLVYEQLLGRNNFMSYAELSDVLPDQLHYGIPALCRMLYEKQLVIARYAVDGRAIAVGQMQWQCDVLVGPTVHKVLGALDVDSHNWRRVTRKWGALLTPDWQPSYLPEGVQLGQVYADPAAV